MSEHLLPEHGNPDLEFPDDTSWQQWANEERVSLVMFSSGIDSAYTLVKLLKETKHKVLVHHIHFINDEGRFEVEAIRARAIIQLCEKLYRPFFYSESSIDHRSFPFFGYDIISVGFEAGIVAHSYQVSNKQMIDGWTIGTCTEEGHWAERFIHAKAACQANCFPHKAPNFFMMPLIPKKEEIDYLPQEILKECWTCRWPVKTAEGYEECGKCKTCLLMAEVTG